MGNLTPFLPALTPTVKAIYEHHLQEALKQDKRVYLGGSAIGKECARSLWYQFRDCAPFVVTVSKPGDHPGRMYRLFETGHLEEERFVAELRAIGCEVVQWDEARGLDKDGNPQQIRISHFAGHFAGHLDAMALGVPESPKTWHLVEMKTHNNKSFKLLKEKGVKGHKPEHWAQCQVYMGGTKVTRALYLARNKDTDELYSERIEFDRDGHLQLLSRAKKIIEDSRAPLRISERPDHFGCKYCDAHAVCFGTDPDRAVPAPVTCRTCIHSTPVLEGGGGWMCEEFDRPLPDTNVGADCPAHLLLPDLITFAEAIDSDVGFIQYEGVGVKFANGSRPSEWTSKELTSSRGPLEGPKDPAFVTEVHAATLIESYPWRESELVWDGHAHEVEEALDGVGISIEWLNSVEPLRKQTDNQVNAAEYRFAGGDYLVVVYLEDHRAAIWRGKS